MGVIRGRGWLWWLVGIINKIDNITDVEWLAVDKCGGSAGGEVGREVAEGQGDSPEGELPRHHPQRVFPAVRLGAAQRPPQTDQGGVPSLLRLLHRRNAHLQPAGVNESRPGQVQDGGLLGGERGGAADGSGPTGRRTSGRQRTVAVKSAEEPLHADEEEG
jgi:hypothetical protein